MFLIIAVLKMNDSLSECSQKWDFCRHTANKMNFHLTPNPEEGNDKIF